MSTSTNLGLTLTSASEAEKNFLTWRSELAGDTDSNMTKIDTAIGEIRDSLKDKAPIYHAAVEAIYGCGTSTDFGHVKLSDATNSTSEAISGIAATPKAVKAAYDLADSKQDAVTYGYGIVGEGIYGKLLGFVRTSDDYKLECLENPICVINGSFNLTDLIDNGLGGTRMSLISSIKMPRDGMPDEELTPEDIYDIWHSDRRLVILKAALSASDISSTNILETIGHGTPTLQVFIPLVSVNDKMVTFSTTINGITFYVRGNIESNSWLCECIDIDDAPSEKSNNLVRSGGVYSYVDTAIQSAIGDALGGSY